MDLRTALIASSLSVAALACSSGDTTGAAAASSSGGGPPPTTFGGDRPVTLSVPKSYAPGTPTPLVILLHGYSVNGSLQEIYFQLKPLSDARGFLYAHPDGTLDASGNRFWNATDACCGPTSGVDDSAYLIGLVDEISAAYDVDPKAVFFLGHSNGGFMSYRMACDHADRIAAIASLAGATWNDTSKCKPTEPVSALEIHGTADDTVSYTGDTIGTAAYPSAETTALDWAAYDGCSATPADGSPKDLDSSLAGAESTVQIWDAGCKPGGRAELWSIQGAGHIPDLSKDFAPSVVDFLLSHPKP